MAGRLRSVGSTGVFPHDAPSGKLWELWQKQGWAQEARHYLKLGRNIQCKLCPNECLLEPEDRSHCRNRVHKDGKLYTLAYADPCTLHIDPIEKKPLLHFLPGTTAFSLATAGCCLRCLNCQNWDISQRKPEETKDPRGEPLRLTAEQLKSLTANDADRLTVLPEDVVHAAEYFRCPSIAYTYSEPIVWFEYMMDTAKAARAKGIKNCWITCGNIQEEPLVELCKVTDAANVNLKSFDETIYRDLNTGKLQPVLDTLKTLKREGVWFEVTHLVVPTYTDKPPMIRRMCDWLLANLGPDYPLHFSRFHPAHKLTHLPPTPVDTLLEVRDDCPYGRAELRLRWQLPGSRGRRDDVLPAVQEADRGAQRFQRADEAYCRRQVPVVRRADRRRLGGRSRAAAGFVVLPGRCPGLSSDTPSA